MVAKIVRLDICCWVSIVVTLLLVACPIAYAHKPLAVQHNNSDYESAQLIPDHAVSWAIYEELGNSPDYYKFEARVGERFFSQMMIPKIKDESDFAPALALIGPGMESAEIEDHIESKLLSSVPFPIPDGMDSVAMDYVGQIPSVEFYEPFTQTTYWERQQIVVENLPATGMYYLVAYDNNPADVSEGRKYTMAIGEREEFSALDLFTTLPDAWFETKFFFGDYVTPALAIAAMLAALASAVYLVKRVSDDGRRVKLK